jgi:hypothetical protein
LKNTTSHSLLSYRIRTFFLLKKNNKEKHFFTSSESIILVFTTSKGVVKAAAMPPANEPQSPASKADGLSPFHSCHFFLKYSNKGNCIHVKGIYDEIVRTILFSKNF